MTIKKNDKTNNNNNNFLEGYRMGEREKDNWLAPKSLLLFFYLFFSKTTTSTL